jgi:hypothetical protein
MLAEINIKAGLESGVQYIMYIMAWFESWILEAELSDELEVLQSCIRGCSGALFLPNSLASPKTQERCANK